VALHTFNILSICSGVGGLELGLRLAVPESRVVAYVEREAYAVAILEERMEENALGRAPIWSDLRTFDGKPWRGKVDCLAGGYPCQPFSAFGKRLAERDERYLWPTIARLVSKIRPPVCFFENVAGHLQLGFATVANDLLSMGYRVKAGLFTAKEVGAPHKRERLFILAYRESRDMADGSCQRGQGCVKGGSGEGKSAPPAGGRGAALENPDDERRRGWDSKVLPWQKYEAHPARSGGDAGIPLWPPRPNDAAGWNKVPVSLKPLILRMADGLADRVDRIRACGNGIVPLVAAHAWRALTAGLELKWHD
jgi:DNA (cytosine-5)-methyltransferase 1